MLLVPNRQLLYKRQDIIVNSISPRIIQSGTPATILTPRLFGSGSVGTLEEIGTIVTGGLSSEIVVRVLEDEVGLTDTVMVIVS